MPRTVYTLWDWTFGDQLLGVYSTEKKAEKQRKRLVKAPLRPRL